MSNPRSEKLRILKEDDNDDDVINGDTVQTNLKSFMCLLATSLKFTSREIIFAVAKSQLSDKATQSPNDDILSAPRALA